MKTTIDAAGPIVIPKRSRERLGLTAGEPSDRGVDRARREHRGRRVCVAGF